MDASPFELRILGPTELRGGRPESDDAKVRTPKRLALLAYLALDTADGFRRRDQIVGLFWPDLPQEAARTQLRKAIHAVRESLGAEAIVSRGESELRIDPAYLWCDAVTIQQHIKDERWGEALALYRGDLLEGLFPEGVSQEFEEWLADRRKALRSLAAAAAWECSREEEVRGDRKAASVMARRALDLTPDDEAGVRRLIDLLDRHGDRGGALRVYDEWKTRLQSEFGVEPAPETRKLVRRVQAARKGESHETPPTAALILPAAAADALRADQSSPPSRSVPAHAAAPTPRSRMLSFAVVAGLVIVSAAVWLIVARAEAPPPNSVAVLPFRAIGDSSITTLSRGMTEALSDALIAIPELQVRSAAYARDALSAGGDVDEIGRRLRVAFVVDGTVEADGRRQRLSLRLVRTRDAVAVWAGRYDLVEGSTADFVSRSAHDVTDAVKTRAAVR